MNNEIKDFELYLKKKNRSKLTILSYTNDVRFMLEYLKKPISEITSDDLFTYKYYMISELNFEMSSINRKVIAINQFFSFMKIDTLLIGERIHFQNYLESTLTECEINSMIDLARSKNDYRFIAIISTLKLTGTRISECLQIKLSDSAKDTIVIVGKGSKRRTIFIPIKLKEHWNKYIKHRKNTSDKLFTGIRGGTTPSAVDRMIKKYGLLCGIDKDKLHCHNLRHYCALSLCKISGIEQVADILGHSSLESTRIYTRKTKSQLLELVNEL